MSILDEIKQVASYYNPYETYIAIVCPFHDDSQPSLMVYEDWFRCLSCGKQGKPEYLLRKLRGSPPKPVSQKRFYNPWNKWIRVYGSVFEAAKFAREILRDNPEFGDYLESRRIEPERFKLGYLHGWYIIPILDRKKRLQGVVARSGQRIDVPVRYVTPKDQEPLLYVPDWEMLDREDEVYMTFGMFDAITLCQLGKAGITVTSGKTVNPELLHDIRKRINIIPDHNEEKEAYALAAKLGWRGRVMRVNYPFGCKDANDLYKKHLEGEIT